MDKRLRKAVLKLGRQTVCLLQRAENCREQGEGLIPAGRKTLPPTITSGLTWTFIMVTE